MALSYSGGLNRSHWIAQERHNKNSMCLIGYLLIFANPIIREASLARQWIVND
jgi:hypothetical protein